MRKLSVVLLLLAPMAYAAQLGPARRVGPIGNGAAPALLGTILPYGDGYIAFNSQPIPAQTSLYKIVATPIDRSGIVQYDQAKTLVSNVSSEPLVAATDTGYILCWTALKEVFTIALTKSLVPSSSHANAISANLGNRGLACNVARCLLMIDAGTVEKAAMIVLDANGAPQSQSLPPPYAVATSLASVNGGYAVFHRGAKYGDGGVTWLDIDGKIAAENALSKQYSVPTLLAHPSGLLLIDPAWAAVRVSILSPDRGILKSAEFAQPQGDEIDQAVMASNGKSYFLATTSTPDTVIGPWPRYYRIGGFSLTAGLEVEHPWLQLSPVSDEASPTVVSNGSDFLVAWREGQTTARITSVSSIAALSRFGGRSIAVAQTSQAGLTIAASNESVLPVWRDIDGEPNAKFSRTDRSGIFASTAPHGTDLYVRSAVWNGTTFALFGDVDSDTPATAGGNIDASGELQLVLLGQNMRLLRAWGDSGSYVAITYAPTNSQTHYLRIATDMSVTTDVSLPYGVYAAAGIPGKTLIASVKPGPLFVLKILDDRGREIASTTIPAPANSNLVAASNGNDEFLLVAHQSTYAGNTYVTRISGTGKLLDDFSVPLVRFNSLPLVEAFGDRWLMVTPEAAIEFPGWKPVDLTAAGTVVAMARATYDRLVLMTRETVNVDGKDLQLLMLRDLVDDTPGRRRSAH